MDEGGRLDGAGRGSRHPRRRTPARDTDPVRTCVGCRTTGSRSDLLRVVTGPDGPEGPVLIVDTRRSMPGRGAWLHPDRRCLELAERRRAFPRALRQRGPVDLRAVRDHLGTDQ